VIDDEKFYKCIRAGYDLIYNPWETRFMRLVRENGGQAYNGLKMLLYQGIDAFELWNGCHVSDESAFIIYKKLMDKLR
jgi:shikimate dehydrogenase